MITSSSAAGGLQRGALALLGLVITAAIAIALVGRGGGNDRAPLPVVPAWTWSDGSAWSPEIPGIDLPLGERLAVPYARDGVVVVGDHEVPWDETAARGDFLDMREGVVMTSGSVAGGSRLPLAQRLELVRPDGTVDVIDSGVIAGATAARQRDGSVLIAYGWLESADAPRSEVRVVSLSAGGRTRVLPMDVPVGVSDRHGDTFAAGQLQVVSGSPTGWSEALLDVADAGLLTDDSPRYVDRLRAATGRPSASSGELSPDRRTYVSHGTAYDAGSSESRVTFPPPFAGEQDPDSAVQLRSSVLGWESDESVLYAVFVLSLDESLGDWAFSINRPFVTVRCSIVSGACERIPHPVEALGPYAR